MARQMLSDTQWALIEPLLPGKHGDRGRSGVDNRIALEGILWIMRTGAPWRDLPECYGKWITAYQRFRRWTKAGVFDKIFASAGGGYDFSKVMIDGTYIKAHQHASGAPKMGAHLLKQPFDKRLAEAVVGSLLNS